MATTALTLATTSKTGFDAVLRRIPSPLSPHAVRSQPDPDLVLEVASEPDLFGVWRTEIWLSGRITSRFSFLGPERPDFSSLTERLLPLSEVSGLLIVDRDSAVRIRAHLGAAIRNDAFGSLRDACTRRDSLAKRLTKRAPRELEAVVQLQSQLTQEARICRELFCELGATFFEREERFLRGLYALARPTQMPGDGANVIYADFCPRPDEATRTLPLKVLLANEVAGVTAAERLSTAGMFTLGDLILPWAGQRLARANLTSVELQTLDNVLCRFDLPPTTPRQLALAL